MQTQKDGNAETKELIILLEHAMTFFLASLDEKRLLEIYRKLIETHQRGELSDATFNYISRLIGSQWANKKLLPVLEKMHKSFDKFLSMSGASPK